MTILRRRGRVQENLPPTAYPPGTFIKTEAGYFYIVSDSKRFRLLSHRVLASWAPPRIAMSSESAVKSYRIAAKMKFRDGSLIHNLADGKIYLIVKGQRRQMISPEAFARIGAKMSEAVTVSPTEINLHEEGAPIF